MWRYGSAHTPNQTNRFQCINSKQQYNKQRHHHQQQQQHDWRSILAADLLLFYSLLCVCKIKHSKLTCSQHQAAADASFTLVIVVALRFLMCVHAFFMLNATAATWVQKTHSVSLKILCKNVRHTLQYLESIIVSISFQYMEINTLDVTFAWNEYVNCDVIFAQRQAAAAAIASELTWSAKAKQVASRARTRENTRILIHLLLNDNYLQ